MIGSRLVNCLNKLWQIYPCKYIPRHSSGCGNSECKNPKCPCKPECEKCEPCCCPCCAADPCACPPPPDPCCSPPPPDPCCCPPPPDPCCCPPLVDPCCCTPPSDPCCSPPPPDPCCCPPQPDPCSCSPQPDPCCCPPKPDPCCCPQPDPCCCGPPEPNPADPCCFPISPCCEKPPPCPPEPPCCAKDPPCPPKPPCCPKPDPCCPPKPPCCPKPDPCCPPKPPCCPKPDPCCPPKPPCCPPKPPCCAPKPPCCAKDPPCPPKPPCCPPKPPCCPKDPPCPPKPPCCPPKPPCCPPKPPCCPKDPPCPPKPPCCPPKPPCCPPKPPCCPKDPPCPPKPPCCPPKPPCCPPKPPCCPKPNPCCPPKPGPCCPKKEPPCPCPPKPPCKTEAQNKPAGDCKSKFCRPKSSKSESFLNMVCEGDVDKAAKALCFKALQTCAEARKILDFYRSQRDDTNQMDAALTQKEQNTRSNDIEENDVNSEPKIYNSANRKKGGPNASRSSVSACACAYCKTADGGKKHSGSESKMLGQGKSQGSIEKRSKSQFEMKGVVCPTCTPASQMSTSLASHRNNAGGKSLTRCDGTCPLGKQAGSSCACIREARERIKLRFASHSRTSESKITTTTCPLCKKGGQQCRCNKSQTPLKKHSNETKTGAQASSLGRKPGAAGVRPKSQKPSECNLVPSRTKTPNVTSPRAKSAGPTCICNKSNVSGSKLKVSDSKMLNAKSQQCSCVGGAKSQAPLPSGSSSKMTRPKSTTSKKGDHVVHPPMKPPKPSQSKGNVATPRSKIASESKTTCPRCLSSRKAVGQMGPTTGKPQNPPAYKTSAGTCPLNKGDLKKDEATCPLKKKAAPREKPSKKELQKTIAANASTMSEKTCPLDKEVAPPCTTCLAGKTLTSGSGHKFPATKSSTSIKSQGPRLERSGSESRMGAPCPHCKKTTQTCNCKKSQAKASGSDDKLVTIQSLVSCAKLAGGKSKPCDASCPLGKKESSPCTCSKLQKELPSSEIHVYGAKRPKQSGSEHKLAAVKSSEKKQGATCPLRQKESRLSTSQPQKASSASKPQAGAAKKSKSDRKLASTKSQTSCEKLAGAKSKKCGAKCPLGKKESSPCTCYRLQRVLASSEIHPGAAKRAKQSASDHKLIVSKSQTSQPKLAATSKKDAATCPLCQKGQEVCSCKSSSQHKIAAVESQGSCKGREPRVFKSTCPLCKKPEEACRCLQALAKAESQCKLPAVEAEASSGKPSKASGSQPRKTCAKCPLCKKDEEACTCLQPKPPRGGCACSCSTTKMSGTTCKICKKDYSTCACKNPHTPHEKQPRSRAQSTSAITDGKGKDSQKVLCSCCKLKTLCETDCATPCLKCQRASKACIELLCKKYKRLQDKTKLALRASYPCSKVSSPCYRSPESAILCRQQSVYIPTALSQRLGVNIISSSRFSSKSGSSPCGGSQSSCNKEPPGCPRKPERPCRMPGPCRPPTLCKEDPCSEGCRPIKEPDCDLLCELQSVFRDQPTCERQQLNRYFGDCYKNKEYHMYNKETFHELERYMKKYRNCQPSSKNTLPKPPCTDYKK